MNRVLVVLTTIATRLGTATAAGTQTALASDQSYVPVSAHAATYHPSVQRFDKVMLEASAPQAP